MPLGNPHSGSLAPQDPSAQGAKPLIALSPYAARAMSHGSEKRVRNRHLTIRLSVDERAVIEEAAERALSLIHI